VEGTEQDEPMWTSAELVAYLTDLGIEEVNDGVLRLWRHRGTGPAWHKVSRRVYYAPADVRAWIRSTRRETAVAS
jgi:hypothetical protein